MSTSQIVANIAGLLGSLLLIVQGGIALWRRWATKSAREQAKESRNGQSASKGDAGKGGVTPSGTTGGTTIDGATLLENLAEKAEEMIDRYQPWHGFFFIGGAALLAFSYLLPLLHAWISQGQ